MTEYTNLIDGIHFRADLDIDGQIEMHATHHAGDGVTLEFYETGTGEVRTMLINHFRGIKIDETISDMTNDTLRLRTLDNGKLEVMLADTEDAHKFSLTRLEVKKLATAVGVTNDQLSTPRITSSAPLHEVSDARVAWNAAAVETAARLGLGINFRYAKGDSGMNIEPRRITGELSTAQAGAYTLVTGHDPDREDWRAFRLDRIKGFVQVIEA